MKSKKVKRDTALENLNTAWAKLSQHPMFSPLVSHTHMRRKENNFPKDGWAIVDGTGTILVHPKRLASPEEWMYVLAHCLLHLGFGHFKPQNNEKEWNFACDLYISKFLNLLKFGNPPDEMKSFPDFSAQTEEKLYERICETGLPDNLYSVGMAGLNCLDMNWDTLTYSRLWNDKQQKWQELLSKGLVMAVTSAVNVAAGYQENLTAISNKNSAAYRAKFWFISNYPLLGALAASFEIIEDPHICNRLGISIAAIDVENKEIFINPAAGLDEEECRFVIAHELLHAGLRHDTRCQGRDFYLWNIACDYVVNAWLIEMGVGVLPEIGVLYDQTLKGYSAEAVYDIIVTNMRYYRKLSTLRGFGLGDIFEPGHPNWWETGQGIELDEFFRRSLSQGLSYHNESRGFLPAGLIEEIRALSQPPISWDVELAHWFDSHFAPLEKIRTFARPSRRQSSTPDIARPRWIPSKESMEGRTFGVILDTSGSMDNTILAKALGTIASYSIARDVSQVRVVFCDAATYDQGYMNVEDIAGRVKVKGRGGTVLQPAIDLLEKTEDFPEKGPFLIITDGYCDRLKIKREHAFLLPKGNSLPFIPRGKVFRVS